ncbi:NEW3 domain-containing protein [Ruminococcaceae bacterium OttesenSCG-928-A16]|nr:NEW3 domain-containing protein [Ruminococcaceae bacterium OttesenSCG-928-A16]
MEKRRFTGLVAAMVTALVLLSVLASVPALAAGGGSGTGATPEPTTAGIEVTGYELFTSDASGKETKIDKIGAKSSFWVRLIINDSRLEKTDLDKIKLNNGIVKINLNAASFSSAEGGPRVSNVFETAYQLDIPVYYNGIDTTFACDIFYSEFTDLPLFHYSTSFHQLVPATANSDSSSDSVSNTVTRGTGFVLKSASYGASDVPAGKSFNLNATLLSTNGTYSVENVSVSLTLPKEISLVSGNSITYVGTVKPNQNVPVNFDLLASAIAEEGSYIITVNISGVNAKDGTDVTASMDISVPVVQPERFEISNAMLPEYLTVGMDDGSGYSSITLVNKGKGIIYNVSAQIVGEGLSSQEGNQFLGNIAAGGQNSADFTVTATQAGQLNGQVLITYENAKGEEKTLTKDFTVTAEENMFEPGIDPGYPLEPPVEEPAGVPGWVWLLVVVGVLAVGTIVVVIVVKKKKAKKAAELEEDLENDDDLDALG